MGKALLMAGALALGCMCADPAFGGEQAAPAAEQGSDAKKKDKSKKVCRTIAITGTRMSERHCRSQEDWDKDAEYASRYLEEGQQNYRRDGEMSGRDQVGAPR